jgi:hypothetical protein
MNLRHATALAPPGRGAHIDTRIIFLLMIVCLRGCRFFPESMFELAADSRLPHWFMLPKGLKRADVMVTMYCYIGPSGRSSTLWLLDKNGTTLAKVNTVTEGLEPHYFGSAKKNAEGGYDRPEEGYPAYEVETANGITEVTEFKRMEPVFYVTDDPEVKAKLGLAVSPDPNKR